VTDKATTNPSLAGGGGVLTRADWPLLRYIGMLLGLVILACLVLLLAMALRNQ
jgi:hypothetical protein